MTTEDKINAFFHSIGEAGTTAMMRVIERTAPGMAADECAKIIATAGIGIAIAGLASTGMNRADTITLIHELTGTMAGDIFNADGTPKEN